MVVQVIHLLAVKDVLIFFYIAEKKMNAWGLIGFLGPLRFLGFARRIAVFITIRPQAATARPSSVRVSSRQLQELTLSTGPHIQVRQPALVTLYAIAVTLTCT